MHEPPGEPKLDASSNRIINPARPSTNMHDYLSTRLFFRHLPVKKVRALKPAINASSKDLYMSSNQIQQLMTPDYRYRNTHVQVYLTCCNMRHLERTQWYPKAHSNIATLLVDATINVLLSDLARDQMQNKLSCNYLSHVLCRQISASSIVLRERE